MPVLTVPDQHNNGGGGAACCASADADGCSFSLIALLELRFTTAPCQILRLLDLRGCHV